MGRMVTVVKNLRSNPLMDRDSIAIFLIFYKKNFSSIAILVCRRDICPELDTDFFVFTFEGHVLMLSFFYF